MGASLGNDDEIISAINVTPLVDVVLVLLIVLMITATAIVSKSIQVNLPEASTGEETPQGTTLAISIDAEGKLFVDTAPVSEAELVQRVKSSRETTEDVRAIISADGQTQHRSVVRVIDMLRANKVTKFAISTKKQDLKDLPK